MRRFSSALTRSADRGRPAGIPSRIPTRPRPCDSPAVVKRNVIPRPLTLLQVPITDEPDIVGLALVKPRGPEAPASADRDGRSPHRSCGVRVIDHLKL